MDAQSFYRINKYLTLTLERDQTFIYINDEKFIQCKYLLLEVPLNKKIKYESIDEISDIYNKDLEAGDISIDDLKLKPSQIFWAHCSNLEAWYENGYDTRILHKNLSFPLLKKLAESGDPEARKKLRKEILERYASGSKNVQNYLIEEGYLKDFSKKELIRHSLEDLHYKSLKNISIKINEDFASLLNTIDHKNGKIIGITLNNCRKFPIELRCFKNSLVHLRINSKKLKKIPDWIEQFVKLKKLEVFYSKIEEIPDNIIKLNKLQELYIISNNRLNSFPNTISRLKNLVILSIKNNNIYRFDPKPNGFKSLQNLILDNNKLKKIPDFIPLLPKLETLSLKNNLLNKKQKMKIKKVALKKLKIRF